MHLLISDISSYLYVVVFKPQFDMSELVDPSVEPSGPGCTECEDLGGWWFHLRRCTACGNIGCCDTSPSQHASKHAHETGHAVISSYEPGESWLYDYRT